MARAKNIVSVARNSGLVLGLVGLSACSVVQENPNYQYSSKYQDRINTSYASNGIATTPATYTTASTETYSGQVYAGSHVLVLILTLLKSHHCPMISRNPTASPAR